MEGTTPAFPSLMDCPENPTEPALRVAPFAGSGRTIQVRVLAGRLTVASRLEATTQRGQVAEYFGAASGDCLSTFLWHRVAKLLCQGSDECLDVMVTLLQQRGTGL